MRLRSRDPRSARFLTPATVRWIISERAWTPYYLKRYWRFLVFRVRHPEVVCEGFVFLGKRIEWVIRPGYGRIILGEWVHIGNDNKLRAHNGTLRLGEKVILGQANVINTHLDIEIGRATLISDWVYICDFDHGTADLATPIKDQPLVTSPVLIGPECWVGVKASVLRGTQVGHGCVLAAHTVARGTYATNSIVAGIPGTVRGTRGLSAAEEAELRRYLAEVSADKQAALRSLDDPR